MSDKYLLDSELSAAILFKVFKLTKILTCGFKIHIYAIHGTSIMNRAISAQIMVSITKSFYFMSLSRKYNGDTK